MADTTRKSSSARGYDHRWRKYRLSYLRKHPLCTRCKAAGLIVPSTVVDHIVKAKEKPELFWEPSNHAALCATCHSGDKQRQEKSGTQAYRGVSTDGTPLDPSHHWNGAA